MNSEVFRMMVVRDGNEIPIKFRVAVVISIGGIVYTLFRTGRLKGPKLKPSLPSPGHVERGQGRVLQDSSLQKVSPNHIISRRAQQSGQNNFLLTELKELVKECNIPVTIYSLSYKKNGESLMQKTNSFKDEEQIKRLQDRVRTLEERETNLETQLMEYYGVKAQESSLMELKNQLRLTNVEGKLYNIKIESLVSSNKTLEAHLVDYNSVAMELEAARAKIIGLRKKLMSESEQNRDQILALQEKVMEMNNEEKKAAEFSQELGIAMMEREGVKEELEEMKVANRDLKVEIFDLTQKLGYVQMLAKTASDNEEVLELREEKRRLGDKTEGLQNELDSLKVDRSKDVSELAYLRWTNTFLKHKLSDYQAESKMQSLTSEGKAKHHSTSSSVNKENSAESIFDIDYGLWSSSQMSPKDSENHGKPKVFAKLKKLLRKKGSTNSHSQRPPPKRTVSVEDFASQFFSDFPIESSRDSSGTSRRSFDIPRSYSKGRKSAAWESSNCSSRTMESLTGDVQDWSTGEQLQQEEDGHSEAKSELLKYAEALKKCNSKKFPKRPAQFLDLVDDSI